MIIIENLDNELIFDVIIKFDWFFNKIKDNTNYCNSVNEDFDFTDMFYINNRDKINELQNSIHDIFSDDICHYIDREFCKGGFFSIEKEYKSRSDGVDYLDKNKISLSHYFNMKFNGTSFNLSKDLFNKISKFKIRFSTHLNNNQIKNMFVKSSIRFYHVDIPPVEEKWIKDALSNIFNSYTDFIIRIDSSDIFYDSFDDIPKEFIDDFNKYQIQKQ